MPIARVSPDLVMHYRLDDFTDPWKSPETILMLHGNAESGAVWFGWVPQLARHYRIIRPDMRGFGDSTPMPADYRWSLDGVIDDYVELLRQLGVQRFHLIGAKLGGTVARRFAARHPDLITTLTVVGTPPPERSHMASNIPAWTEEFSKPGGVGTWARRTMGRRLGSHFPPEGADWWSNLMGRTPESTQVGFMKVIPIANIEADLPRIQCPTMVVTTEGSALGSVEKTREWQTMIPNSKLLVLPGDSYHVATSHAEQCAAAALDFIRSATPG